MMVLLESRHSQLGQGVTVLKCSIMKKLNLPTKSDLVPKTKTELRVLNLRELTKNLLSNNY